jgi:hypothetical protein
MKLLIYHRERKYYGFSIQVNLSDFIVKWEKYFFEGWRELVCNFQKSKLIKKERRNYLGQKFNLSSTL